MDLKDENCKTLAQNSLIFHEPELLRTLLSVELEDHEQHLLFTSCFYRGIFNVMSNLKGDYINFLKDNNLLDLLT